MTKLEQQNALLRAKLNQETSRMQWTDLLRYFAGGHVVAVSDALDLVDVAMRMSNDDKAAVAQWLEQGRIGRVSDATAQAWVDADVSLWTVVVRPWVLVQLQKPEQAGAVSDATGGHA